MRKKTRFTIALSLFVGLYCFYCTAQAVPPWQLMVDEAITKAQSYQQSLSVESSEATTSTSSTTKTTYSESFILARQEWANLRLQEAKNLGQSLSKLPAATDAVALFKTLEDLKELKEQREKESLVAKEQATLAAKTNKVGAEAIARDKENFYAHQAEIITNARKELNLSFENAYPDEEKRKRARTAAFKALSQLKGAEKEAARKKAKEALAKADEKKRRAQELAAIAKKELAKASTKELKALAKLRLQYANISAAAQEYRAKALEAEVAVRDAEEQFQNHRANLNEQVPAVLALAAGAPKVGLKRTEWKEKFDELEKSAEVLEKKAAVLRERVEYFRDARDKHREHYDELYSNLDKNRKNKTYRQRVYFARQVYRTAADQLDLYRTRIELIERERKHLLRAQESFGWALEKIADHVEARYLGQTANQWSLFLLGLVLTYISAYVLRALFNFVFRRFAAQSSWNWDNIAMEELGHPIRILAILAGIWFSLKVLTLSAYTVNLARSVRYSLEVLWIGFLAWRILNIITRVLEPRFEATETTLDDQLLRFISRALRGVIVLLTFLYLLENFGWKVSSLLAGLGIGGLAFALAAKDTLANLFGSIVLFLDRPFHVGNWVKIAGAEGIVEDIGIRSTRVRTFKDTVVTIPNATVANSSAENIHSFRKRRLYFTLTLRLDTPAGLIEETVKRIREILTDHPMILDGAYVYVNGIPADGIQIMVYAFVATRDWGEWLHHGQTVYLTVLRMLEEIGVGLAYSTKTIELENKLPIEVIMKGGN